MSNTTEQSPVSGVRERAPLLRACAERYRESTPFEALTIGVSAPLTPHTGLFLDVLAAGGAEVLVTGEFGSAHADVLAWLDDHEGITPLSTVGMSETELADARRELLAAEPDLLADDGAYLLSLAHDEFPEAAANVRGACEQTTGGITRLQAMDEQGVLSFPVYDVNGAPMKQHFDNVHGTAESSLSALTSLTDMLVAGSVAVVGGYGQCGRGLARKLRALGARTIVTEADPRKALEAVADGHEVRPMREAVPDADLVVTATGRFGILRREHIEALADGAVVASIGSIIEIDTEAFGEMASDVTRPEPGVARYQFPDGRTVTLLTDGQVVNLAAPNGEGNPTPVMDTTFALMSRGLAAFAEGADLSPGLHPLPEAIDRAVAREKLDAIGVDIDEIPDEQRAYREQWAAHEGSDSPSEKEPR
ncbi:adenosylhomocysteinase [Halovenus aranensis]|uniref:Adenosylhomocysteinase n=1 Tax=Halovenus aranensis TaxID=890420 RepID=A0A1G8VMT8_9EURY|nr:adenosylhomocysteinase [Halovenus aranensis]SDJ67386.1 adenosylhomocysteinase [Halovenus aranensis]